MLAFRARCQLTFAGDKAAAFLAEQVKVPREADAKEVREHIARLDHDDFATRKAASDALRELGSAVAPLLRQALADKPSFELRRRLQGLLDEWRGLKPTPDDLRNLRAVAVLDCRHARGTPGARETGEGTCRRPADVGGEAGAGQFPLTDQHLAPHSWGV